MFSAFGRSSQEDQECMLHDETLSKEKKIIIGDIYKYFLYLLMIF